MLSFRKGFATVLLLALPQSFVLASLKDENNVLDTLAKMTVSIPQGPWIDGIDSVIRPSDSSCADEIAALTEAVGSGYMWALQMLDASSKIQSGILKGNLRNLGMYDECVEIDARYNDTDIRGKYCTVSFDTLSSAVCVPSSCNETQVAEIVNAVIQNSTEISGFELEISGVSCMDVEYEDFTAGEISAIIFFSTVGAFMIFCTVCGIVNELRPKNGPGLLNQLAKFSLYTNAISLLSTRSTPQTMPAIQGMRFLSMCWVILGHRYLNTLARPMVNSLEILDWYSSWTAVYIQAAPFAVDTFFVISGFLMSYLFLKSKQAGNKTNYPMMYLHRYLRLTPCLGVLMLFVAVLFHRTANGPLWGIALATYVDRCRENWWVNLLYVQNFVKIESMCLGHTWYLAVDMQLFWISPIILYPLNRWPKYGIGTLGIFLIASLITPTVHLAINGYSNAVLRLDVNQNEMADVFYYFYIPTYNRACAYFVGILLGYDVANKKRCLTQVNVAINWTVACIFLLTCGIATHFSYSSNFEYDIVMETAFAFFLRPIWSVAIAWILYACTQGYGGVVTRFLSLPLFLPLSRLSYCMYLVHMVIQVARILASQNISRFSDFILISYFWADLVLSITVAFIFSLFFESPVVVLEKILFNRNRKRLTPVQELKKDVEGGIDNKGMTET